MVESNPYPFLIFLPTIDQPTILVQVASKKFIIIKSMEEFQPAMFTQQPYPDHQVGLDRELAHVLDPNLGLVRILVPEIVEEI